MACPTCDHTMQLVGEGYKTFWCPRCGTIKFGEREASEKPKLVDRALEFGKCLPEGRYDRMDLIRLWCKELSVAECLYKGEE